MESDIINKAICDCREEVEILMRYGHHRGIVTLKCAVEEAGKVYLVLQYLRGGDLLDYMTLKKKLSEPEAAAILKTLAITIAYLHENGVVHRDLKPAHIMFAHEACTPDSITICDMGFAKQLRADNGLLMTPCYTANYVAPEVLKRQGYDAACDIWSLGVVLYIMLSARCPFSTAPNDSPQQILDRINSGKLDLQSGRWAYVSQEAKELVASMLHISPQQRPKASHLVKHPWVNGQTAAYHQAQWAASAQANRTVEPNHEVPDSHSTQDKQHLKETVAATFRAIAAASPQVHRLGPVVMSELARRRMRDKIFRHVEMDS